MKKIFAFTVLSLLIVSFVPVPSYAIHNGDVEEAEIEALAFVPVVGTAINIHTTVTDATRQDVSRELAAFANGEQDLAITLRGIDINNVDEIESIVNNRLGTELNSDVLIDFDKIKLQ